MTDWYTHKYGEEETESREDRQKSRHRKTIREQMAYSRRKKRRRRVDIEEELAQLEEEYEAVVSRDIDEEDEDTELSAVELEELEFQQRRNRVKRFVNRETLLDISSTLFSGQVRPPKTEIPMEARVARKVKSLIGGAYGVGLMVLTNDWLSKRDIK